MATPRTSYYNFEQTYNLGSLQPIGYGPFPVDNPTGFTTLRFSGLGLGTARVPQDYVRTDNHLNIMLFDPSDPTKYATYKSNPIATGTATDPGTSTSPWGGATFTDGDYSISTDVSDWNLFGGINSLEGLCVGFYSNASSFFPTTAQCPNGHLSSVPTGSYKYWMWEMTPATGAMKYSKEEIVEKYANSIDSCPIFADRSTKDANGDQIDTTYLKSANASKIEKVSTSLPPVYTHVAEFKVFTDGRVSGDASDLGVLGPVPEQSDNGKILEANWTGSPGIGTARWVNKPTGVPASVVADEGKVLTVDNTGAPTWKTGDHYSAGSYIDITNNVITNTMHVNTTGLMVSYNTLVNSGVTTHSWGPWRIQITKKAMATWDDPGLSQASIEIRFAHQDYLDGTIVNGSALVERPHMWKDGDSYTTSRWSFTGAYSSGPTDGFTIALDGPTDSDNVNRALSHNLMGWHFNINCGINSPDWLTCKVYPMYINNNTSIDSNGARLLIQATYFYV